MKTLLKNSIALLGAGLLISSLSLASDAEQDTSFLKQPKNEVVPVKMAVPIVPEDNPEDLKTKYFAMEASYNFNMYKPSFNGYNTTYKDFDNSGSFGVGIGMFVNKNIRTDIMASYTSPANYNFSSNQNNYNSKVTTTKLMLNGTYDFVDANFHGLSPYLSAGIGAACNNTTTTVNLNGTNTYISGNYFDFAYQAGLGFSYKAQNDMILELGYLFLDNGKNKEVSGVSNKRLQSQAVVLGLKVPF